MMLRVLLRTNGLVSDESNTSQPSKQKHPCYITGRGRGGRCHAGIWIGRDCKVNPDRWSRRALCERIISTAALRSAALAGISTLSGYGTSRLCPQNTVGLILRSRLRHGLGTAFTAGNSAAFPGAGGSSFASWFTASREMGIESSVRTEPK